MTTWLVPAACVALALLVLGPGLALLDESPATPQTPPEPTTADTWQAPEPASLSSSRGHEAAAEATVYGGREGGATPDASLDCIIEPSKLIDIGSPVRGRIEKVHVERGDPVEAGQVIVELESSVEQAAVDVARLRARMTGEVDTRVARLALSEARRRRANELQKGDALSIDRREEADTEAEVSRRELQQAREGREMAALELRRAEALLARRSITSPISGYVVDRLMSPGEVVDEETVLRLAQTDPLRVEVILPSDFYGSVRPGMRGEITPDGPGETMHVATVTIVDRVVDPASSTFGVRLELPNPDGTIPGGLRCRVLFLEEQAAR